MPRVDPYLIFVGAEFVKELSYVLIVHLAYGQITGVAFIALYPRKFYSFAPQMTTTIKPLHPAQISSDLMTPRRHSTTSPPLHHFRHFNKALVICVRAP